MICIREYTRLHHTQIQLHIILLLSYRRLQICTRLHIIYTACMDWGWIRWSGNIPLSTNVYVFDTLIPRYPWYMLSGAIGDIFQFVVYNTVMSALNSSSAVKSSGHSKEGVDDGGDMALSRQRVAASFSFLIAYVVSIALRQRTHGLFVFGKFSGSFIQHLLKVYASYIVVILMSTVVNAVLLIIISEPFVERTMPLRSDICAYFLTTAFSGIATFHLLKKNWRDPPARNQTKAHGRANSGTAEKGLSRAPEAGIAAPSVKWV